MKRRPGLNLVERAVIAQQWHATVATAQIHALIGESSVHMVNKAGRVFYVVLGAAMAAGLDHDEPAVRVMRGAINAVHDQAGEEDIPALRRQSIVSGLTAAAALIPTLQRKDLVDAACELTVRLRAGAVVLADFEAILKSDSAAPSAVN